MFGRSFHKYATLSVLVALICGFLHALPLWGRIPSQATLFSAARGLAASRHLDGYLPASALDSINGWLWKAGGASLLSTGKWILVFLSWALGALIVLAIIWLIVRLLNDARTRAILFGSAMILVLATGVPEVWSLISQKSDAISDVKLLAPVEMIDKIRDLPAEEIFATSNGLGSLLLFAPEAAGGLSPEDANRLSQEPAQWRERLRNSKWRAVLLAGPLNEFRALLDHLISSPDWHLAAVTNQGYLFLREPGLPAKSLDVETFRLSSDQETAIYLAQIAERYDAIRRSTDARASMERAGELAPDSPSVLAYTATFAAAHKRWQDAIAYSNKALQKDPEFAQAKLVQALALLELGEASRADVQVSQVLLQNPNDLYTLFLAARIAKARNDNEREADLLEKIVALSQKANLPVVHYRIYLGQAYARLGRAQEALKNYREVLAEGKLNAEQATEIKDAIATIEAKEKRLK